MYKKIKLAIFNIIEPSKGSVASKIFDFLIIFLIVINIIFVIAETFDIPDTPRKVMYIIEAVSVIIFSIEYILRVWTSDLLYPEYRPLKARFKYIFSFMALVDLIAILPFYLPLLIPLDLRVLRIVRVFRLLRIFKINRYTKALGLIAQVFKNKASQLISSMMVVGILIVIASVLMYNIESTAQPDAFSNAVETMWWAVATLTTVGYGDVYPVTPAGRILATIIAFLGIGMVAVPTGIITAGFTELIEKEKSKGKDKDEKKYCPYCGHNLED